MMHSNHPVKRSWHYYSAVIISRT